MKLVRLFTENKTLTDLSASSIDEALSALLGCLEGKVPDKALKNIHDHLVQQESRHPTMMNSVIWLPHIRAAGVKTPCICMGISPGGVPIHTDPETTVAAKLIFLVLTPEMENTLMLQTMAAIARLCINKENVDALSNTRSPQRAIRLIADTGIDIKKPCVSAI